MARDAGQLLLLRLLVVDFFSFADQPLDVRPLVEVLPDQILREPLVEDQAVVVLVEALSIHRHESEELWVDHFFCLQDSHFVREHLP